MPAARARDPDRPRGRTASTGARRTRATSARSDAPSASSQWGPISRRMRSRPSSNRSPSGPSGGCRWSLHRTHVTARPSPRSGASATNSAMPMPAMRRNTGIPIQNAWSSPEGTCVPKTMNGSAKTGSATIDMVLSTDCTVSAVAACATSKPASASMLAWSAVPVAPPPGVMRLNAFPGELGRAHREPVRAVRARAPAPATRREAADGARRGRQEVDRLHVAESVVRREDLGDAGREEVDADHAEREEAPPVPPSSEDARGDGRHGARRQASSTTSDSSTAATSLG